MENSNHQRQRVPSPRLSRMSDRTKGQPRKRARNLDPRPCSRCGTEPRVTGQRWGSRCRLESQRRCRPWPSELGEVARVKARARARARRAVATAKLTVSDRCADCRKRDRPTQLHHHRGYHRPLDVVPLCGECHRERHRKALR